MKNTNLKIELKRLGPDRVAPQESSLSIHPRQANPLDTLTGVLGVSLAYTINA